jgi:hypothetical protein
MTPRGRQVLWLSEAILFLASCIIVLLATPYLDAGVIFFLIGCACLVVAARAQREMR